MRDVLITGVSVVAEGADLQAARFARKPPRLARMDRLCGLALVATEHALTDAALDPSTVQGERLAVVVGTRFGCHATNEAYYRGLLAEGVKAASPRLFAYTLPSSPLGEVSIHIGARGPGETIASGRHAGLEALIRAGRLCASNLADAAVAIAVEVGGGTLPALGLATRDGAVAFIVERADAAHARGRSARAALRGGATAFAATNAEAATHAARARAVGGSGLEDRALADLPVLDGHGAVDAAAALAAWIEAASPSDEIACAAISDELGGAAAVLLGRTAR